MMEATKFFKQMMAMEEIAKYQLACGQPKNLVFKEICYTADEILASIGFADYSVLEPDALVERILKCLPV